MDVKELRWLQQVVPLAYKALQALTKWETTPRTQNNLANSHKRTRVAPPARKRRRKIQANDSDSGSNRRVWVRQEYLSRDIDGLFATTFHRSHNPEDFRARTGMTPQVFDMLFSLVGEQLNKNSIRRPISPECRLFLTLVYLSNAERVVDLSKAFKMGSSTVRGIVQETSDVLWSTLAPAFMPEPSVEDWKNIVDGYQVAWKLPHCLGAVGAKLLDVSYKSENDIVLLASCDSNHNFTCIDIATVTDAINNELHWHLDFGSHLINQRLSNLLPAEPLSGSQQKTNFEYSFIADSSFTLRSQLITPYENEKLDNDQRKFNQHLLSALRGSIEKAFSVLMSKWCVLSQPLRQSPSNAEKIVKATVVLHNFLKLHDETYCPVSVLEEVSICPIKHNVPSSWLASSVRQPLAKCRGAIKLRDSIKMMISLKQEFRSFEELVGSVEWTD